MFVSGLAFGMQERQEKGSEGLDADGVGIVMPGVQRGAGTRARPRAR